MLRKLIPLSLALLLVCSCATTHNEGSTGNHHQESEAASQPNDLYNANKEVQQPQAKAWGWLSNQ